MKILHHLLHHPLPLLLLPDPIGQGGSDPGGHHHQADPRCLREHKPMAGHH